MSDEQDPDIDNTQLINTAAQLMAASIADPRLVPIAEQAKRLVLDSDKAVLQLFLGWIKSQQPPPAPSERQLPSERMLHQQTPAELLQELKQILKGK